MPGSLLDSTEIFKDAVDKTALHYYALLQEAIGRDSYADLVQQQVLAIKGDVQMGANVHSTLTTLTGLQMLHDKIFSPSVELSGHFKGNFEGNLAGQFAGDLNLSDYHKFNVKPSIEMGATMENVSISIKSDYQSIQVDGHDVITTPTLETKLAANVDASTAALTAGLADNKTASDTALTLGLQLNMATANQALTAGLFENKTASDAALAAGLTDNKTASDAALAAGLTDNKTASDAALTLGLQLNMATANQALTAGLLENKTASEAALTTGLDGIEHASHVALTEGLLENKNASEAAHDTLSTRISEITALYAPKEIIQYMVTNVPLNVTDTDDQFMIKISDLNMTEVNKESLSKNNLIAVQTDETDETRFIVYEIVSVDILLSQLMVKKSSIHDEGHISPNAIISISGDSGDPNTPGFASGLYVVIGIEGDALTLQRIDTTADKVKITVNSIIDVITLFRESIAMVSGDPTVTSVLPLIPKIV